MWSTFIEISKMERKIKCPCCDSVLVVTHQERYQDLSEHVSNPNRQPSMKDGYQCPNTDCIANICDVAWIEDGDTVIDPTSGVETTKEKYYKVLNPKIDAKYTFIEAIKLMYSEGQWGPWK